MDKGSPRRVDPEGFCSLGDHGDREISHVLRTFTCWTREVMTDLARFVITSSKPRWDIGVSDFPIHTLYSVPGRIDLGDLLWTLIECFRADLTIVHRSVWRCYSFAA